MIRYIVAAMAYRGYLSSYCPELRPIFAQMGSGDDAGALAAFKALPAVQNFVNQLTTPQKTYLNNHAQQVLNLILGRGLSEAAFLAFLSDMQAAGL